MRITDVDIIPIYPRLVARAAQHNAHYPNWNLRTVFRVRADNGLVGFGDFRCPPPDQSTVAHLVGRSPFDFLANDFNPGLGGALYDLMGKHLEVPAYKLLGQKARDRVPVAAWSKPVPPETLAAEVKRAVAEGYSTMKMHSIEYYDILEQNRAVEEVAPPGFLMHYDFNHNRSLANVLPIVTELERSRTVGWIEDPLRPTDVEGWRQLRAKTRLPLIMHPTPLGGLAEIHLGMADAYMIGGQIGLALRRSGALTAANSAAVLQVTGGTLTKALAMHLAAVIPACSLHTISLDDQYKDAVTTERIPVVAGASPVPERPGLGYDVDEDALAKLAANPPTPVPKHVAALRLAGGRTIYFPSLTTVNLQKMTGREEGTLRAHRLDLWDDDGTPEFARIHHRVNAEGPFIE